MKEKKMDKELQEGNLVSVFKWFLLQSSYFYVLATEPTKHEFMNHQRYLI